MKERIERTGFIALALLLMLITGVITRYQVRSCADEHWRNRIVDDPDGIARIRSAVILQREADRLMEHE